MKQINIQENNQIVNKALKQIKLNKILWTAISSICLIVTILMIILASSVLKNKWTAWSKSIAISIPVIITCILTVMTVFVYLGNKVGTKTYKNDFIIFYSGPWTNILYINDKLVYKGSSEQKMEGILSDNSVCKIKLGLAKVSIVIVPPDSNISSINQTDNSRPKDK